MYFIDANIFLELLLDQERAAECENFLEHVCKGSIEGLTTDFIIDSIILIMEREGKSPSELSLFLLSLLGYKSLQIYFLSIRDRIEATKHMQRSDLDYDDSTTYQAMNRTQVDQIVSFDKDFDRISSIKRLEPKDAL
ncbi:MAG: type II toxin-antitoxin system VapC family toxin [Candidatus Bathyarchaeia archaeon]